MAYEAMVVEDFNIKGEKSLKIGNFVVLVFIVGSILVLSGCNTLPKTTEAIDSGRFENDDIQAWVYRDVDGSLGLLLGNQGNVATAIVSDTRERALRREVDQMVAGQHEWDLLRHITEDLLIYVMRDADPQAADIEKRIIKNHDYVLRLEPGKLPADTFQLLISEYMKPFQQAFVHALQGDLARNPLVTIEMENGDLILVELYPQYAPNTVNNFIFLAENGFYDGLIFHRVMPGFVVQGGDPEGTGMGGPGYYIIGEFTANRYTNPLRHERGVLSMARAQHPDSAGSQFFVLVADRPDLDNDYATFGRVIEGMDAIDRIVAIPTDANDRPLETQQMKKVTVETFGVEYPPPYGFRP